MQKKKKKWWDDLNSTIFALERTLRCWHTVWKLQEFSFIPQQCGITRNLLSLNKSFVKSPRQTWAAAIPGKKFEFLDFNSKQKMSLSVFSFELMPTSTQNVYIGTRLTKNAKITNKKFNFWKLPIHFGVAAAHICADDISKAKMINQPFNYNVNNSRGSYFHGILVRI